MATSFVIDAVDTVSSLPFLGVVSDGEPEPFFGLFSSSETRSAPKPRRRESKGPPRMTKPTERPRQSDRELVDKARDGNTAAFGELVKKHQQRIHRLAIHMLRDRAEAEDVTQETFIRAYQALARFDGRSEPYTWFYRITINLSLNRIRSRKSRKTTHDTDDPRLDGVLIDQKPATADPGAQAQRTEMYQALTAGIDGLSDTLRTTLILVCIDGRSHEEVASILGAPEGTIAWRVHEARRKLKEFMQARGFDPEGDGT